MAILSFVFRNVLATVRLTVCIALRIRNFGQDHFKLLQDLLDLDLIRVAKVKNSRAELVAHLLQQFDIEVIVSVPTLIRATETGLQGECVRDAHFFPDDDPCRSLLCFLDLERAVLKVEEVKVLVDQLGEDLLFHPVVDSARIAVHEDVLLATVAV